MQSMKKQRALYFRYGTCIPDDEFRTMTINGVNKVMSVREIVKYKEKRVKDLESQREQIEETRKYNLKKKAEIEDCRKFNLKQKAKKINISIKDMIGYINKMGTIG